MAGTAMFRTALGLTLGLVLRSAGAAAEVPAGVPVLIYHEIFTDDSKPGLTRIALRRFEAEMDWLAANGYTTLSVRELVAYMQGQRALPGKAVVLTFDDGWKNVLNAVPVLERHHFKASFWIITGKGIGGDYLDWNDIAALAREPAFEIGSHTVTHPWDPKNNLVTWVEHAGPGRDAATARFELVESRRELEHRLDRTIDYLAWPCGWYDAELLGLAREAGYRVMLTTEPGLNTAGTDVQKVRRTFVDGSCDLATFGARIVKGQYTVCEPAREALAGPSG